MSVLINCSNLHGGGGVSVATSFLDCLSQQIFSEFKITLLLSSKVHSNLCRLNSNLGVFEKIIVDDIYGWNSIFANYRKYAHDMKLMFTVFGPIYILRKDFIHISGIAQPYIIYPKNAYISNVFWGTKFKILLNTFLKTLFVLNNDTIIVEREKIKDRIKNNFLLKNLEVFTVSSTIHSIYKEKKRWEKLLIPKKTRKINFGLIARNYPHKNLEILANVKKDLLDYFNIDSNLFVTLSNDEWNKTSLFFKKSAINLGSLILDQCPSFYESMDAIVMPTLLESFSSIPIETMVMEKPFFGSNLDFMKDVCGKHCIYIDPFNSRDIAYRISEFFKLSEIDRKNWLNDAKSFVNQLPNANERCHNYMSIIISKLNSVD